MEVRDVSSPALGVMENWAFAARVVAASTRLVSATLINNVFRCRVIYVFWGAVKNLIRFL